MWMKGEEEFSVIYIKVVVEKKGRDESVEGSGVHDEKQRTKNRALRTPQEEEYKEDRWLSHLTGKDQDDR